MERFCKEYPDLAIHMVERPVDVAADSDAVVLVTEWQEYRELDWESMMQTMTSPIVLDGRNVLDGEKLRRYGYRYISIV